MHDLKRYQAVEEIIEILSEETETTLTGVEIGQIFGADYNTVSQIRKKMRLRTAKDKKLREVIKRIEKRMSI